MKVNKRLALQQNLRPATVIGWSDEIIHNITQYSCLHLSYFCTFFTTDERDVYVTGFYSACMVVRRYRSSV